MAATGSAITSAVDQPLMGTAFTLTKALNRVADENLPGELAGIVKLHAGLGAGAAFIPVPLADVAVMTANIWAMYIRINKAIGLPFSEHKLKSIVAALVTNLARNMGVAMVLASVAKLFPGLGTIGGAAILGATSYAFTIAAGIVYMKALAKLHHVYVEEFHADEIESAINEVLSDKEAIKAIIEGAKQSYTVTLRETEKNNTNPAWPCRII